MELPRNVLDGPSLPKPLNYNYSHTGPTWDHSIVLPPIIRAARSIPPNGSILDIGCGNCAMLAEIRKLGSSRSLSGIDSPGAPNITVVPEGTSA
jgi:hypothetical protein